jgi:molecular chaperone Hsp33
MDNLFRYITHDGSAVLNVLDSTDMIREMERRHHPSATASAALGRVLTAASMMGYGLKGPDDSITLMIRGNGPVGSITAVSDGLGNVRGYCDNPFADVPEKAPGKLDVGSLVGEGTLYVVQDMGLETPYVGQIELQSGEIAEDITAYFAYSEQLPTVCSLGVLVDKDLTIINAGGFLLHLLPGAEEQVIDAVEENIKDLPPVTEMLASGMTPDDMAKRILRGLEPDFMDSSEVAYKCNCSRERMEKVLISLGREELERLAEEQEETEIVCHFCNTAYRFSREEMRTLADSSSRKEETEADE